MSNFSSPPAEPGDFLFFVKYIVSGHILPTGEATPTAAPKDAVALLGALG